MTPTECAALLRQHQEWRRFEGKLNDSPPMLPPKQIGEAIDVAIRIIERSGDLLAALEEITARIKDHPVYAQLTEDEELSIGGDTAEFSYLARLADSAIAKTKGGA